MIDYAHCRACDKVINLDKESWSTDGSNTYCEYDSTHKLPVNACGEFSESCVCGGVDFFTVVKDGKGWKEIEPITKWEAWACITCERVFNDNGEQIDKGKVKFQA